MREKKLYRRLPCEWYELGAVEHWLGDLAEDGWQLEKLNGVRAVFRKGEARSCRYRFYPCNSKTSASGEESWALFEEMGWEYVCAVQQKFVVFRCDDFGAPELCTDPVVEAEAYRQICKDLRWRLVWLLIYPFFYAGMYWLIDRQRLRLSLVHLFAGGLEVLVVLLFLLAVSVAGAVRSFQAIRAVRGKLARGEPIDHEAPYPQRRLVSHTAWNALSVAALVMLLVWINSTDEMPIEQAAAPVPAPLLANLEGEGFTYGVRAWKNSTLEARSTLLSECFAETRQTGGESMLWLDSTYIRVRSLRLTAPLFRALTAAEVGDETSNMIFGEAVSVPVPEGKSFDEAACFKRQRDLEEGSVYEWLVIVQRGKQLLSVQYTGEQPLERLLEEMDDTLRRFEEGQQ